MVTVVSGNRRTFAVTHVRPGMRIEDSGPSWDVVATRRHVSDSGHGVLMVYGKLVTDGDGNPVANGDLFRSVCGVDDDGLSMFRWEGSDTETRRSVLGIGL